MNKWVIWDVLPEKNSYISEKDPNLLQNKQYLQNGDRIKCFVYGVREYSNFILLHVAVQFSQHHLLKRLSFLHCISLPPLS